MLLKKNLPAWAFNTDVYVLHNEPARQNPIGEALDVQTTERGPYKMAKFPVSELLRETSELTGVELAFELYTEETGLNAQEHLLRVGGQKYRIDVVKTWEHFSVLGVSRVES